MKKQWKLFRDWFKKMWNEGGESKPFDAHKEVTMNIKWNHVAGQWMRFQKKAKEEWDELSDSELREVNGRFDVLATKIQEKYSITKEEANQQIDLWTANLQI